MQSETMRNLSFAMMGAGVLVIVLGVVDPFSGDDDTAASEQPAVQQTATTTIVVATSAPSTSAATASTAAATTAAPTTTVAAATTVAATTTVVATTTTTIAAATPSDLIVAFVDDYVDAIETEDVEFLVARLHPAVLDLFDGDLCRTFIEREILALGNYTLTGDVSGPETQSIGDRVFEAYSAPTSFVFQGQTFDSPATFAFGDDEVRWFTNCR